MLCHHQHGPTAAVFHGCLRPISNTNPSLPPVTLHFPTPSAHRPHISPLCAHESNHSRAAAAAEADLDGADSSSLSRRQNAVSTALILLQQKEDGTSPGGEREEELLLKQQKRIVEEASLATGRIHRFPGSVDFPGTERIDPPPPPDPRRALGGDDLRALHRALEIRRRVASEALKAALRAGTLRINYSTNLVSRLPEFVDRIVIGAAAMKGDPQSSHLSFNVRAKTYIQNSGVVALVKWLKHNHLTLHQIGKVICLCSGDLEQVRRVCEWLKTIHVRGEFLGVVLMKAGPIWERSSDALEEIIDYLEENGVRRDWVGYVVRRCPRVLALTMEEVKSRTKFYLDMGMSEKDFGTMVYAYPKVFGFCSMEEMNSKVKYLKEFGLSTEDVGQLLAFRPHLMGCSIEEKWKPLVKYLYYLGVRRDGLKRILMVKPMVFCVDLETTIAPKVQFLRDIGVREEGIGGALVKFPHLLTYSLYKKIRPVVIFLMTKAGVTQTAIGKVIALDPQLVGCNIIKKLDVNVKYFLSLGIRLRLLGEMIADFPMLLRYNPDILRPKYRYLRRNMVRPLKDLIEFPRFFSYSLEDRIVPRHKIMVANRVNFKLRYMLAGSDEEFNQRVEAAIQRRKRFESRDASVEHADSESIH